MNTEMMAENTIPSEHVNRQVLHLLSGVSTHGDQHLAEVERDLVQVDGLLEEAIKKLCASFMAIHQAVAMQQAALDSMRPDAAPSADLAAQMKTIHEEINRHVGAAMTGLQFQDMTSQLIGRMVKHLSGLREVFGALDGGAPSLPESGDRALIDMLDRISDRVGARCTELSAGVRSTVNQRHMESGDVELF